jgi:hypothetical protein
MLTLQEIFDKSVSGILKQGTKAYGTYDGLDYVCVYRSPEGYKCAAGQLIDDEHYDSSFEGRGVDPYLETATYPTDAKLRAALEKSGVPLTHDVLQMISALQRAHDEASNYNFVNDFRRAARVVAEDWGLHTAVLDTPEGAAA